MHNQPHTPAFAVLNAEGKVCDDEMTATQLLIYRGRDGAENECAVTGESVAPVMIVGAEEWERQGLLNQWIASDDTGVSSFTLWSVFAGVTLDDPDVPSDAGDARLCIRFLALCKIDRSELSRVAEAYPIWKPYVDRWGEVDVAVDSANDLHLLMEEIENEALRLKGAE